MSWHGRLLGHELKPARFVAASEGVISEHAARRTDPDQPAVVFEAVSKRYSTATKRAALSQVSLSIPAGRIFGIIGRSGAGKSTLLRLVNGLERPSAGHVRVHGADVGALEGDALVDLRRSIGMVFQHFNLLSAKTVRENIALPLRIAGVVKSVANARVDELLDLVGLRERADAWPARLSGGEKQRVGIARALANKPDILLCDEATSSLDPETTRAILALLHNINRQLGVTIVLITHEMEVIRDVCDAVAVIEGGEVVETGPVWQVFGDPRDATTRALLHGEKFDAHGVLEKDGIAATASDAKPDRVLLEIRYTGERGADPDLSALTRALNDQPGEVRFLQGGIERIQGRPQGRFVVSAPLDGSVELAAILGQGEVLAEAARAHADHVEVLGYA